MARWDKEGLPHKGWEYVGMEDLGEDAYGNEEIEYEQCEMCGHEKIRYMHLLRHPEIRGEIRVGCVCAEKLIQDYNTPKENEHKIKNRTNRRKNFLNREWRYILSTGNYTLRYKGENITIMKSKYGPGWGVIFQGEQQWKYHNRKIEDFDTAKVVAFNLFDDLHESYHEPQPYWDGERWIYQ